MTVKMLDGRDSSISGEIFEGFKMKLKGYVLLPGDNGYNESRTVWNGMTDKKPSVIVKCLGAADVIAAVCFAREHNLLLCIKGGGHNIAGLASAEGGMMLDMSLMRGVWTNKKTQTAHAQSGCQLGDVDRETQLHGLAGVLGFVSQTGIAGLTLGGGFGYLTRRWGWTADNLRGMEVVTADGKLVSANENENPDLYWALRGGGGNFGVVTSINFKLYPVGPQIAGGIILWPVEESERVLELYRDLAEKAPRELTLVAIMRPSPPAPWIPKEWHLKPVIMILACWSGKTEEADKYLAPIKSFGKPIADIIINRPYVQMQSILDAANPKGRRYYWKSEYLPEVTQELKRKFIAHGEKISSPFSAMILFQLGGALNELDDNHSPAGNRRAKYVLNITSAWEHSADDEKNIQWARNAWEEMKEFSTGGTYLNFLNADDKYDRTEAALGKSIRRLREIKSKWDPDNFFRMNWNIKPLNSTE
jgi:FAD/FMN-containing dehydrogenase